jgi:hypothetical protein
MKMDIRDLYLFDWKELEYLQFENEIGIHAFKILNANQEKALQKTQNKFGTVLRKKKKHLKNMNEEEKQRYCSQFYEREEKEIGELQRQQRYSMCVSLFSFFEGRLKTICNKIEQEFVFKIKIDDLNKSDDLKRYWNYLEKVFEMKMKNLEPLYTPIKQNKEIRNKIAHKDGNANAEEKKRINNIVKGKGLSFKQINDYFQIQISDTKYILYLIDIMSEFLDKLISAIDGKYMEKKKIASIYANS